jgi:hypothetical protein
MEGMQSWIGDAAIQCDRDKPEEWIAAIETLDDEDTYETVSSNSKAHIESMRLFTEASRIAGLVESFAREHPVVIRAAQPAAQETRRQEVMPAMPREPIRPVGFGFSNGRLRIQR